MARKKKKVPQVNSTSSADIAFMLLLFFLLTSSMDTDRGLARRLPPPPEKDQKKEQVDVKTRNILVVLINTDNQVLCGGDYIEVKDLKAIAKEFISNPNDDPNLPEKIEDDVPFFGTMKVNKPHVISLQNDRGTRYQAYIDVQNELAAAYNELRNEVSKSKWGKGFDDLNEDQQKAVQMIYPQKISEAEPKNYGEKKDKK
jgi:biopolymer transport protein ExbD